jgi:DNA polymerase III epsilon subunit-like protein
MPIPQRPAEAFVSVDIEAAGPSPSRYALLAIGACLVADPERGFYAELRPWSLQADPEAMAVHGLSLEALARDGEEPAAALVRLEEWLAAELLDARPVFVGFNAPFDWMFVADAFHRYLGRNPFGYAALDIKSLYTGLRGVDWADANWERIAARYGLPDSLPHNALADARLQARLFATLFEEARRRDR